jgi:hypothetical protein
MFKFTVKEGFLPGQQMCVLSLWSEHLKNPYKKRVRPEEETAQATNQRKQAPVLCKAHGSRRPIPWSQLVLVPRQALSDKTTA